MHVLVAVVEIEFPTRQWIGHHHIDIAVQARGRLARARLADGPLCHASGRERRRNRHTHAEQFENPVHADLPSVGGTSRHIILAEDYERPIPGLICNLLLFGAMRSKITYRHRVII